MKTFMITCATLFATANAMQTLVGAGAKGTVSSDGWLDMMLTGSTESRLKAKLETVSEVDSQGNTLSSGSTLHSFDFAGSANLNLGGLSADASLGVSAQATTTTKTGTLLSNAQVINTYFVFDAAGTVQPEGSGGLSVDVVSGTAEMRTNITGWPWCNSNGLGINLCGGEAGAFMDLDFAFETKGQLMVLQDTSAMVEYDAGAGTSIIFSKRAWIAGQYRAIESGYPMLMTNTDTQAKVRVRIPRVQASGSASSSTDIVYDPIMRPSGGGVISGSGKVLVGGNVQGTVSSEGMLELTSTASTSASVGLQLESMTELNANGNVLSSNSGTQKRVSFTGSSALQLPFGSIRTSAALGVDMQLVTASVTGFDGMLSAEQNFHIFRASHTVQAEGSGGLTYNVNNGTAKTNVRINNWPFCQTGMSGLKACSSDGAMVEARFKLKTRTRATVAQDASTYVRYNLGAGATTTFSKQFTADGSLQTVVSGYPQLDEAATTDTEAVVVVRMAKPSSPDAEIMYDPYAEEGSGGGPSSSASTASAGGVAALLVAMIVARFVQA